MDSIIVVWANSSDLERRVPLLANAKRNIRIGSKQTFELLFLSGFEQVSVAYKDELAAHGYRIHDGSAAYQGLAKRYVRLNRFGNYDRNCFLRWLVIREVFGDSPFIHYDGDVVFNALPEELARVYQGLTFVLQGCPAFCHVADRAWLGAYQDELDGYYQNMEQYSAQAWTQREALIPMFKEKNGGIWERELISSDQDLLQFLTLSGRLPQADLQSVTSRSELALFQNPLCIGRDIHMSTPLVYERSGGVDFLNGAKVALWHMQNDFTEYVGYASYLRTIGKQGRIENTVGRNSPEYSLFRILRKYLRLYSRRWIYEHFFGEGEDLSFLLNGDTFWQQEVFA